MHHWLSLSRIQLLIFRKFITKYFKKILVVENLKRKHFFWISCFSFASKNIVDIGIGWNSEPLPTDRILECTARVLDKCHLFRIYQIELTTLTVLDHFIQDAVNYAQLKQMEIDNCCFSSIFCSNLNNRNKMMRKILFHTRIKLMLFIGKYPQRKTRHIIS